MAARRKHLAATRGEGVRACEALDGSFALVLVALRLSDVARFVVFRLDRRRFALPLTEVERALRAVEVTPLPQAPEVVLGAIDLKGRVIPVLNVRERFLLPARDVEPSDWFLLAHAGRRLVALVVDESEGVVELPQAEVALSSGVAPGLDRFPGVLRLDDDLVLIHDLERFFSLDESLALEKALGDDGEGAGP